MPRPRKRRDGWAQPRLPITSSEIGDIFEEHNAPRPDAESCEVLADVFTRRAAPREVEGRQLAPACILFSGLQYRSPEAARAREHANALVAAIRAGVFPDWERPSLEESLARMLALSDTRTRPAKRLAAWAVEATVIFGVVEGVLEGMGATAGRHRRSPAVRVTVALLKRIGFSGMTEAAAATWLAKADA